MDKDADTNGSGDKDETGGYGECGNISFTFCIEKYSPFMIGCAAGGWRRSPKDETASTRMTTGAAVGKVLARGGASSSRRHTFFERGTEAMLWASCKSSFYFILLLIL